LGFFEELIGSYQQEHNTGLSEIAAALAFLTQQERPLLAEDHVAVETVESPRHERARGNERTGARQPASADMEHYRIEVGREHGAQPKNIVGAIANEAGLDSRHIGHIKLYDTFSTVDLPKDMPKSVFKHLQKVWVCGQRLQLSLVSGGADQGDGGLKKAPRPRKDRNR
jgi:ATP-dependent RNA helicase DeaD